MSDFIDLDLNGPATVMAVVAALVRLTEVDEHTVQEFASNGRLEELFRIDPRHVDPGPDFLSPDAVIDASPWPLSAPERAEVLEANLQGLVRRLDRSIAAGPVEPMARMMEKTLP